MKKKFISQIIGDKEIAGLTPGGRYLISAGTNAGKSVWCRDKLVRYCYENKKRVLIMSPLETLKKQGDKDIYETLGELYTETGEIDLIEHPDMVVCNTTYQAVDQVGDKNPLFRLDRYDYVICDEAHTLVSYACFGFPQRLIPRICKANGAVIFVTATPDSIRDLWGDHLTTLYEDTADNNPVASISTSYQYGRIKKRILDNKKAGGKVIVFNSSAKKAIEDAADIPDAAFICSHRNENYAGLSDTVEYKNIVQNECFAAPVLFTTTALSMGINIKDKDLNLIVINGLFYRDEIMQIKGRLRQVEGRDKVRMIVREPNASELTYWIGKLKEDIAATDDKLLRFKLARELKWYKAVKARGYATMIEESIKPLRKNAISIDNQDLKTDLKELAGKKLFKKYDADVADYFGDEYALQADLTSMLCVGYNMRKANRSKKGGFGIKAINEFMNKNKKIKYKLKSESTRITIDGKRKKIAYWCLV